MNFGNGQGSPDGTNNNHCFYCFCQRWFRSAPPPNSPVNNLVVRSVLFAINPPPNQLVDRAYYRVPPQNRDDDVPLLQTAGRLPSYASRYPLQAIEMMPSRPIQSPDGIHYWPAFPHVPRQCMVPTGRYGPSLMLGLDGGAQIPPPPHTNAQYPQMPVYPYRITEEGSRPPVAHVQGFVPYQMPTQNDGSPAMYGYHINPQQIYPVPNEQLPGYGAQNVNQWAPAPQFVPIQNNGQGYQAVVQPPTSEARRHVQWFPGHEFVPSQASAEPNGKLYRPESVPSLVPSSVQGVSTSQMQNQNLGSPSHQQFEPEEEDGGQFTPPNNVAPPQMFNWVVPQPPFNNGGQQFSQGGWWGAR